MALSKTMAPPQHGHSSFCSTLYCNTKKEPEKVAHPLFPAGGGGEPGNRTKAHYVHPGKESTAVRPPDRCRAWQQNQGPLCSSRQRKHGCPATGLLPRPATEPRPVVFIQAKKVRLSGHRSSVTLHPYCATAPGNRTNLGTINVMLQYPQGKSPVTGLLGRQ